MSLEDAHKGYEYQDLFSAYHILNILLANEDATFLLDVKEHKNDKFDDLTIILEKSILKRQIKYSEDKIFKKADLSASNYDLALDTLFQSWQEMPKNKQNKITLCLAWEYIEDQELDFLVEINSPDFYQGYGVKVFAINIEQIWPLDSVPISTWKRLRSKVIEKNIQRNEFVRFIESLKIELNLPKSSINLNEPGPLEKLVLRNLKLFGVGKFPNNKKNVVDVAMHLMHLIKHFRAKGGRVEVGKIVYDLGLIKSHGSIDQEFVIDKSINVLIPEKYTLFKDHLYMNQKTCVTGAPGSGKSWFIQNFKETLAHEKIKVIEHYCYTGIDDTYEKERITIDIFLANLINDILKSFPELQSKKPSKYGVDFEELQLLLNEITEDVVLIVDGLDHIGRIYNMHKDLMLGVDTEIVNTISRLNFSENIKVVLASQPYSDVIALKEKGFELFNIEPWDIYEVIEFMKKNQLTDVKLHFEYSLLEMLLKKSEGNPLYLTYLVNELSLYVPSMISKELIEQFPPYNNNLEDYYSYLMNKLDDSLTVPQILAGSPFSLSESELKEITGMGKYVTSSLEIIRSILSFNSSSGGYMIYHESFRRFTLNLLEENQLSVEKVIYAPLIEWLTDKGIYTNRKSYLNLFILLFESKKYIQIIEYCNQDFIVESVFSGNNINSINNNLEIIMKAACMMKDYGAVIKCTELNSMMISFKDTFEENSEYFYSALGLVNGFDSLKEMLIYESDMALSLEEGLKVCYLCSQNSIVPEWEKYINAYREKRQSKKDDLEERISDLDYFKYYVCAQLDMGGDTHRFLEAPAEKKYNDYRLVVIEEYSRRDRLQELREIVLKIEKHENWLDSIEMYTGNVSIDEKYLDTMFDTLRNSNSRSDKTLDALNYYYKNINWIILNHEEDLLEFIKDIEDRNWYYNWLIFICDVNRVTIGVKNDELDDAELVESYDWLIKDTDCFKGKPRTHELYNFDSIIYDSIVTPLRLIKTESTWSEILRIIDYMSSETMTSMRSIVSGPLPTHKLLDLILEIANQTNYKFIAEIFEKRTKDEDRRRIYSYLADYSLKHTILLAKNENFVDAKLEFRKSIIYLLSYGFRKDRTLSRLMDSVGSIHSIDNSEGVKRILNIKSLADAVVHHTDGSGTNSYPVEWFETLTNHNRKLAMIDLALELFNYDNTWVLEDSFDYLLESIDSSIDPLIENILYKTRPNNSKSNFVNAFLNNIQVLIDQEELLVAKQSMFEFLSRFDKEVQDIDIVKIEHLCNELDIKFDLKVINDSSEPMFIEEKISLPELKNEDKSSENNLEKMSYDELIEYVVKNGIANDEIQFVVEYFEKIPQLDDKVKLFINSFIKHAYEKWDDQRENFLEVLDTAKLKPSILVYFYMAKYLNHRDGWFRKFTKTNYFVQAMELDREEAERYFFAYMYNEFYGGNYYLSVGDRIINSLTAVNHNSVDIIKYWDSLYEIIDFRLSGKDEYDFPRRLDGFEEWNDTELLLLLLLTRFKFGEATRYKWLVAGLEKLLSQSVYRLNFGKPLEQYLKNYEEFPDYSLIIILTRISEWYSFEELSQTKIIEKLSDVYPTRNEAVNYLIRKIIGINKLRVKEEYIFHHEEIDSKIRGYTMNLIYTDNRLRILEESHLYTTHIVDRFLKSVLEKNNRERLNHLVHDKSYHLNINNVYFYDILTREMATEVEKVLNAYVGLPFLDSVEDELFGVVIGDIDSLSARIKSISLRPLDLLLPEHINYSYADVEYGEWCRLAYHERWYNQRIKYNSKLETSNDSNLIVSGVIFGEARREFPFLKLNPDFRQFDENFEEQSFVSEEFNGLLLVTSDLKIYEDDFINFTSEGYLGIRSDILNKLKITLVDNGDGIIGIDTTNQVVLKYSSWEVCLNDVSQSNYRIPYLKGAELKVKNCLFDKICGLFDSPPKMFTKKLIPKDF